MAGGFELALTASPAHVVVRWHRPGAAAPEEIALWPSPDGAELARSLARLAPAELARVALEVVRDLDETARPVVDAALAAFGLLGGADADGRRRVLLPVALLADPVEWFRDETVLGGPNGFDAARLVASRRAEAAARRGGRARRVDARRPA